VVIGYLDNRLVCRVLESGDRQDSYTHFIFPDRREIPEMETLPSQDFSYLGAHAVHARSPELEPGAHSLGLTIVSKKPITPAFNI